MHPLFLFSVMGKLYIRLGSLYLALQPVHEIKKSEFKPFKLRQEINILFDSASNEVLEKYIANYALY